MKQLFILITFIILGKNVFAQKVKNKHFSRADFVKTSWFIDNKNNAFLKNDTLRFIKYSNKADNHEYIEFKEYEMQHLVHGYFIELSFNHGIKMNYSERLNNYAHVYDFKEYWWQFHKENNSLLIYRENELLVKLKPIKQRKIKIESRLASDSKCLETTEITFVRTCYTIQNASWFDKLRTRLTFKI
ncbi:hypothetical protein [Kordia sp.]|uniref:hypothetical protein n=1 Tax=Kordia sp. TaxID=1965332 RepID=UPI003B5C9167